MMALLDNLRLQDRKFLLGPLARDIILNKEGIFVDDQRYYDCFLTFSKLIGQSRHMGRGDHEAWSLMEGVSYLIVFQSQVLLFAYQFKKLYFMISLLVFVILFPKPNDA